MLTPRSIAATALSIAALPVAVGTFLLRGPFVQNPLDIGFDPFEIDLQLHQRNDDAS